MDSTRNNVHNITRSRGLEEIRNGVFNMNRGIILTSILAAALPLHAGIVLTLDPTVATPTNAGFYAGGTNVVIAATGTVNLDGPIGNPSGLIVTNPDGSLNAFPDPTTCPECWAPGYTYFLPNGTLGATPYPIVNGEGDGINHFVGGGGNYDAFPDGHAAFAPEGNPTTNTLAPGVIRFGAIAGTFVTNPVATDWFLVGSGGTFQAPVGGGTLQLVVVDTYYLNNSGGYNIAVDVAGIPEPSVGWLAFSGIAALAGWKRYRARS
jgi:hypothetical protein